MAAIAAQTSTRAPRGRALRIGRVVIPLSIWMPLAIFLITRIYGFVVIVIAARSQIALPSPDHPGIYQFSAHPDSPGYLALITNWDGQWYERIATDGYHLPTAQDPNGKDALNTFAFLPLFPMLMGAMMTVTGLSFAVCATIVNLLAGGAAMVVMWALIERTAGRFAAFVAVLFACCFVAAPLYQAAYSESLALLLVCTILLLISRRHYGWAVVVVLLLSLTRLVTPPFAVVVVVHAFMRYRGRDKDPIRPGEIVGMTALTLVSLASVSLWSSITSVITSGVKATGADRANVSSVVGAGRLGWFTNAYEHIGWIGVVGLALVVVLFVALALSSWTRSWGIEVRAWFATYPIYLLFVAGVHTGVLRYLMLAFPLGLLMIGSPEPGDERRLEAATVARVEAAAVPQVEAATIPRKRAALVVAVCVISLALQVPWVSHALVVTDAAGKPWLP